VNYCRALFARIFWKTDYFWGNIVECRIEGSQPKTGERSSTNEEK